ncbi:MAG: hypothetical protein LBR39_05035 [Coriobacteriales bacterium]|jgi:hypothetical protein|nr:hypothetical protein [Coriobacteriales bacterium]
MGTKLEGWHLDPSGEKCYRYYKGQGFTQQTTTDITQITMPLAVFGRKLADVRPELTPLVVGVLAVLGFVFFSPLGVVFGGIGVAVGLLFLRIGRTWKLILGTVLCALVAVLSAFLFALGMLLYLQTGGA